MGKGNPGVTGFAVIPRSLRRGILAACYATGEDPSIVGMTACSGISNAVAAS